ncbi:MAG: SDR family oxidoreductase [Candidatus Hodarchaeales archaeon]|jgi:NADP-dependent 3-hydroxy acid dehydrogenase YdfG
MKEKKLRIIITGGSSGIGESIALEMAQNNHKFYLTGRDEEKLKQVAKKVTSIGGEVFYGVGDVSNENDVDSLFMEAFQKLNGLDILVASAGVGHFGFLEDMEVKHYDDQFLTNVRGVFLWLKKALPKFKDQNSGQIIVISSNLGVNISARASIYSATKHAVQAMIGSLREELKGTNVKTATINPGSVDTPWFDGKDVDRMKMLSAGDVAKAARLIIEQSETSNIDHILLMPGKR